jgi:hypothetical protein
MGEAVAGSLDGISSIFLCDCAGPPSTEAMEEQKWNRDVPLGD